MSLFQSLKRALQPADAQARDEISPEMAAAVLLLSMERADFDESEEERAVIKHLLARHFDLQDGELEGLLEKAEQEAGESISFYSYVEQLNSTLDHAGKCDVLRMLWEVAYADGRLDPFEEQLMRRLADMLYLPHSDYMRLKLQVIEAA